MKLHFLLFLSLSVISAIAKAESAAPLSIGVIVPLSGPLAEFGVAIKNGIQLATKNEAVGSCRYHYEDSQYDSKVAVGAFRKLTQIDKTNVIYTFGGPMSEALAPIAESEKVVLFTGEPEPSLSIGRKYVVRFSSRSSDLATTLLQYLEKSGSHHIGIVRTDNQYINGIYREFLKAVPPSISVEEVATFSPTETDFRSSVARVKSRNFDTIGVLLLGDQISLFFKQMHMQNFQLPAFSFDALESPARIEASGPAINGAVFAANAVDVSFRETYRKTFGNEAQIHWAGFGFDFASMMNKQVCGSSKGMITDEVLAAVKSASGNGVNGAYRYIESSEGDKYFSFPTIIRRIENGKVVTAQPQSIRKADNKN